MTYFWVPLESEKKKQTGNYLKAMGAILTDKLFIKTLDVSYSLLVNSAKS